MSISLIVEGEKKLVALVGTNIVLSGAQATAGTASVRLAKYVVYLSDFLVVVQVAVGIATLVYMLLKIKKVLKK